MSGQVTLYVWSFVLALLFSLSATQLVIRLARRLKLLDVPGGRRLHPRPIPRPGGLAIFAAFGLAIAVFWTIDVLSGGPVVIPEEVRSPRFRLVVLAAVTSVVVGFFDDLVGLRARWQLLCQLVVAGIVAAPIIDTFYVIVRRLAERRPPFAPDRGHFHHRLLDVGLSHRQAVFLIYVITPIL